MTSLGEQVCGRIQVVVKKEGSEFLPGLLCEEFSEFSGIRGLAEDCNHETINIKKLTSKDVKNYEMSLNACISCMNKNYLSPRKVQYRCDKCQNHICEGCHAKFE